MWKGLRQHVRPKNPSPTLKESLITFPLSTYILLRVVNHVPMKWWKVRQGLSNNARWAQVYPGVLRENRAQVAPPTR